MYLESDATSTCTWDAYCKVGSSYSLAGPVAGTIGAIDICGAVCEVLGLGTLVCKKVNKISFAEDAMGNLTSIGVDAYRERRCHGSLLSGMFRRTCQKPFQLVVTLDGHGHCQR